jgi:UDP-N-acetylglucosamine 2-epimerase (non-hydrolysing)
MIKLAPVILRLRDRGAPVLTVHTGQHYSWNMDRIFFEQLGLPRPDVRLNVGSGTHGEQTARLLAAVERTLVETRPRMVLVQGDTNSTLAGALAAAKLGLPVAHIEAGMRTFDRRMPEEINRVVADHLSGLLFAPTRTALRNLLQEGVARQRIRLTGNTSVDALKSNLGKASSGRMLERSGVRRDRYILMTLHRQENVDREARLREILRGVGLVGRESGLPVIWPVHPRTAKMMKRFGLRPPACVDAAPPLGYFEFLELERNARLVLTDSGGIQEEACLLKVPCVTIWESETCWIETVQVGANRRSRPLAGDIAAAGASMLRSRRTWTNPYGRGGASDRIAETSLRWAGGH